MRYFNPFFWIGFAVGLIFYGLSSGFECVVELFE